MSTIRHLTLAVLLLGSTSNLLAQRDWKDQVNPIYVQGSVRMFDGQPPRAPVEIQLDCGGRPQPIGFSAADGSFAIDLRETRRGAADGMDLSGCSLIAEAPGFESSAVPLGQIRLLDTKPVGVVILTPGEASVGRFVSGTSLSAPKAARKAYEKARAETRKRNPRLSHARQHLSRAVELHPEYAEAWDLLGRVHGSLGDFAAAQDAFERSIAADPQFAPPYPQLVRILAGEKDYRRAVALGTRALQLNPLRDDVRFYVAASQLHLGRYKEAGRLAQELIERGGDEEFPQVRDVLRAANSAMR